MINHSVLVGRVASKIHESKSQTRHFTLAVGRNKFHIETEGIDQFHLCALIAENELLYCLARPESFRVNGLSVVKFRPIFITPMDDANPVLLTQMTQQVIQSAFSESLPKLGVKNGS